MEYAHSNVYWLSTLFVYQSNESINPKDDKETEENELSNEKSFSQSILHNQYSRMRIPSITDMIPPRNITQGRVL